MKNNGIMSNLEKSEKLKEKVTETYVEIADVDLSEIDFSKTSNSDDGNTKYVDEEGNSMEHEGDYEDLHNADYDKFLVPIFIKKDNINSFNGNGVIVGKFLITADHVVRHEDGYGQITRTAFFEYMGNLKKVVDKQIVHKGKDGVELWESSEHDDVCVYELEDIYSDFKLYEGLSNEEAFEIGLQLGMKSYRRVAINSIKAEDRICSVISLEVFRSNVKWINCFGIKQTCDSIYPGNSGSALFKNKVVYGILIQAKQNGFFDMGTVIKAEYIKKCIKEGKKERADDQTDYSREIINK